MASEKEIVDTFKKVESEIPGYIAASLVDLESGMTLGVHSVRPNFDLAAASAYNSEIVKQKVKAIGALGLKSTLEDILLTLSDQIHLIKMVSPRTFIYLAADKAQTNLAIVRSSVAKNAVALA
jgi:predicted metal-dependent TIM-barrel fold hydrolase